MSLTMPFYACFLFVDGAVTGYEIEYDDAAYQALPNLYLVNILNVVDGAKRLVAGQFIKTSKTHEEADFAEAIHGAASLCPPLHPFLQVPHSFIPSRIIAPGGNKLTENEMKGLFFNKSVAMNSGGHA